MNSTCPANHRLVITFILLLLASSSFAQQHVTGNRRREDSVINLRRTPPTDAIIQARLVSLALQEPRYEALTHQTNVASEQLNTAKRSWLNLLAISGNFNEFDLKPQNNSQYVYPKYLIGITIPVGLFFTIGPQVRAARETVRVTQSNQEDLARTLRMEILSKYATYKNYSALILLENTILVDQQAAMDQMEKKFQDGSASIEQYNTANRVYTDERVKMLNLQLSQDLIRLDIERMIGTSLDSVIK